MDDEDILKSFPRTRTSKKSSTTQLRIIDAYLKLMETVDFDKVAVSDIVQLAGVTRSTFYAYFDDIYDALEYVENELVAHMPHPKDILAASPLGRASHAPSASECDAPAWYAEWFGYVEYFQWQLDVLLSPHGNPQFPHKIRNAIREAHHMQMRLDGFVAKELQDWLLNALAEFQLRIAKEFVRACRSNESAAIDMPVYALNTIRVGGWYLRFIDSSKGNDVDDLRNYQSTSS